MSIEERLVKLGVKAFNVGEDEVNIVERLKGGMSNYTYLVKVNNNDYVFRMIGDDGLPLVNPKTEKEHLSLVKPLGFTPNTLYLDINNGDKVAGYIKGEALAHSFDDSDYHEVATILRKLHSSHLKGSDYDLKNRLRSYEKLLKGDISLEYHMLKMFWLKRYDLVYSNERLVLCHGDAQRSNFVKSNDGKLYLLDWEFTGNNDPFYDIASFGNINFNDALKLLEVYLERKPTKEEADKVKFYRMFQVLQWHIVATYKEDMGLSEKLHVDFKMVANRYLKMAGEFAKELGMIE